MSADSEFPRGWVINTTTPAVGIVLPALPGIVHVLTEVTYDLANLGAGAAASNSIAVTDTFTVLLQLGLAVVPADVAKDEISWTGQFPSATGAALAVVQNTATPAGYISNLTIQGYDL